MSRPIHHTFGPHITWSYWFQATLLFWTPWRWRQGKSVNELRENLDQKFKGSTHLFSSGREGLLALFRSLELEKRSEIIIQGYTCVALPNAIHAAGLTPIYADVDPETLNLDPTSVEERITPRTRAILCQHTFGIPSDTERLAKICQKHNLILIEDCAHVITDTIGKKGQYVMLSFGRDKAISGIIGGAIISRDTAVSTKLKEEEEQACHLPRWTIARLLMYPEIYLSTHYCYDFLKIGKATLWLNAKLGLLIPILTKEEKKGHQSPLLHRIPNACAALTVIQLTKLNIINSHRSKLSAFYLKEAKKQGWKYPTKITSTLPLQKFPISINNADTFRTKLKSKSIHLEDGWTGATICPRSVDQTAANYEKGSCPHAEDVAENILTLPTHTTMTLRQAKQLVTSIGLMHPSISQDK